MQKVWFWGVIITCALSSCVKAPSYPNIPQIKFVSISSSYVTIGHLDTIIFSFTDGSGSVAPNPSYPSADNCFIPGVDSSVLYKNHNNIFLFKSNDNFGCTTPDCFASPNLQPTNGNMDLSGQIHVYETVSSSKCFPNGCSSVPCNSLLPNNPYGLDTVVYTIYLRDLAGHLSNAVQTPPITTSCQ